MTTLSRAGAMKAKCKECMHDYVDGRRDCVVPACPLYSWMPYRASRKADREARRVQRTPAQIAAAEALGQRTRALGNTK